MPGRVRMADGSEWTRLEDCPAALLDPGGAQIGDLMYVICGFESQAKVSTKIHVFDMAQQRWIKSLPVPDDLPNSHSTVASDGARYIYIAGGQLGAHCSPAVSTVYCYDTQDDSWHPLPPLPAPRYAGSVQLWRGRLHYVGGADVDRWTPMADHWSLGVTGNAATEAEWRSEVPIPVGGMHRGSAIVDDQLYLLGGQQGDFIPIEGDPDCRCTGKTRETYLQSAFRLNDPQGTWERLADMPVAVSHCDFSCLVVDKTLYLYGGQTFKDPETYMLRLTDAIQAYDTTTGRWHISGYLPYHLKMPVLGHSEDRVFITVGQRGRQDTDRPERLSAMTWSTSLPPAQTGLSSGPLQSVAGRRVLMVSHDLTRSGGPLELLELGRAMIDSGADVRALTLANDATSGNLCSEFNIPLVPRETGFAQAAEADLIVVNTAHHRIQSWLETSLRESPEIARRIIWLIHEIDVEKYGSAASVLPTVGKVVFDSAACLEAWSGLCDMGDRAVAVHPGLDQSTFDRATQDRHPFLPAEPKHRPSAPRLLSRSEVRRELGVNDEDFLLLCVGGFSKRKGQELLLRTLSQAARDRQLPVKLALVGFANEAERARFIKTCDAESKAILGPARAFASTPHIDAMFLASDAHIINSQGEDGRGETFGRATVHAMAFGLPVLGTNVGGTPEVIEDGVQGFLYPVGASGQPQMIDHIETLVQDPTKSRAMGQSGLKRARSHFQKSIYLEKMDRVVSSLLE